MCYYSNVDPHPRSLSTLSYKLHTSSQSFKVRLRMKTTLFVLASLFLLQGNCTVLIRADITYNELDSDVVPSQQSGGGGGGGPPPSTPARESVCGCKRILLSSLGPAAHFQPQAMGIYEV